MSGTSHEAPVGAGKLTYADLLSLPEDGKRYEILDGQLAVTPSPATRHQIVSANLGNTLYNHVKQHGLGKVLFAPMDVILDRHTVVEPDIVFIAASHADIMQPHAIVGPPDLLVEIFSRTTAHRDRGAKAALYARFGVEHYWIVDPAKRVVDVYARTGTVYGPRVRCSGDTVLRTSRFPELDINLTEIWD